jgi:hypothetical protein
VADGTGHRIGIAEPGVPSPSPVRRGCSCAPRAWRRTAGCPHG